MRVRACALQGIRKFQYFNLSIHLWIFNSSIHLDFQSEYTPLQPVPLDYSNLCAYLFLSSAMRKIVAPALFGLILNTVDTNNNVSER